MSNYYMLHVWVLDDMTFEPDVFAGMMPCIFGGTAIHDPTIPATRPAGETAGVEHTMEAEPSAPDHTGMDHAQPLGG